MKKPRQLAFEILSHGGKRKGAGRKKSRTNEPSHACRPRIDGKTPLMLTIKCAESTPCLRSPKFMRWFEKIIKNASAKGLRITQFAIERNHLHLIAEADSNGALKKGMQSLIASLKWALREIFNYRGRILRGRFHALICKTPTEVRNALRYVLFNHAKHCEMNPFIDDYSSAADFADVSALAANIRPKSGRWKIRLEEPRSWLQRIGWKRVR
jgi:REP element-mobilizing transposase RayT